MLSFVIGVLGIGLALFFHFRPFNDKGIKYSIQNYPLFKDYVQQIDGIQISIDGKVIKNLTVTIMAIWNSGHSVIDSTDIPNKNPLGIKLLSSENEIISARILHQTNIGNDSYVSIREDKTLLIGFEYLGKDDGFILQILHTEDAINESNILGEIKGIGKFSDNYNINNKNINNRTILIVFSIVLYIIIFIIIFKTTQTNIENRNKDIFTRIVFALVLPILSFFILVILLLLGYLVLSLFLPSSDAFKIGVPNDLQNFFIY
jgi:hypothetical protein